MAILQNDWAEILEPEFEKAYYIKLREFLAEQYKTNVVYPEQDGIFNALQHTPFHKVKVVILGQDPYHGPGQAHGLSFSVKPGVKAPPSLQNMFKELHQDLGCSIPNNGYLAKWAEQGVLLLNTVLTVRADEPNSHKNKGWESFTDTVIRTLNRRSEPVVFMLWGSHAQKKAELITNEKHFRIASPHPSPLSANRGFFGSRPFSRANHFLKSAGLEEIDWQIPNL